MITVSVMGKEKKIHQGSTYDELQKLVGGFEYPVFLAKQDNALRELGDVVRKGGDITFYDLRDMEAMRVYHRSLSLIMIRAAKSLFGEKIQVVIEHSIHKSLYCEVREPGFVIDEGFLIQLKAKMDELIQADLPITKNTFHRSKAVELVNEFGMEDKVQLFRYRRSSNVNLYELDGFFDYFYGYMAPSTASLALYDLMLYENGFLMRFPNRKNPAELLPFHNPKKISTVFLEQMKWCSLMGVDNVADLNDVITRGEFGDLVRINEALHEKKVAEIADLVRQNIDDLKMVLIAGPSSSGKTTFANRLCVQLRVLGIKPQAISLDDYFINREDTPMDEFGNKDFENIEALDLKKLNEDLTSLIAGEKVELPCYNFITGKREYHGYFMQLKQGEILVIEGIHGLNDILTASIDSKNKFKIFISAMTQLNIDDHNRISTSDSRLIRRIVRDNQFRGRDAASTIGSWDIVGRGEEKNIFPFQENADIIFNSATIYELSVLKQYIEPLLFHIPPTAPEYSDAKRLIKFIDYFLGAPANDIPNNSIIKEFVGGSCFKV